MSRNVIPLNQKKENYKMKEREKDPAAKDFLEASLKRLRKRMTYIQDEMDMCSHAIRCIESDLQKILTEDELANETNNA